MKHFASILFIFFTLLSCTKELKFEQKKIEKKIHFQDGAVTEISIEVPVAKKVPVVADSINKKIFSVMKEIVYVGEKPFVATDYLELTTDFIKYYKEIKKNNKDELGWIAQANGTVSYESENILNIELNHYTFTGGAHGYGGKRSLIFDVTTGKSISNKNLFLNEKNFKIFAETKFRSKYKISSKAVINSTSFMFENEIFQLPQTYFYTKKGFLLYYNVYEIASYGQGNFEVLIPYKQMKPYLKTI